ncbi:KdsC family phosphatase [Thermosulfuriphilus sp.]
MFQFPPEVLKRAAGIRLLLLDVDGILTDGQIIVAADGSEIKSFCVRDGMGIKLLQMAGLEVALLTSRTSPPLVHRARELGIKTVIQGSLHKLDLYLELCRKKGLEDQQVAYMGDDWIDLPVLKRVGLAVTVPQAWPPLKEHVHYVTRLSGGHGAVREVADLILQAQGKWEELLRCFLTAESYCF